jgi:NAD+ synthase (glutamine-hydrolysing)
MTERLTLTQLRIGLAQINPCLGDIEGNYRIIKEYLVRAASGGAHLVIFPEMAVTGYPVEDLALRRSFAESSQAAVVKLAQELNDEGYGEIAVVLGYLDQSDTSNANDKKLPQNNAAIIHRGEVKGRYTKRALPNYGVFDEYRNFSPGSGSLIFRHCGVDIAVAICEDIWQEGGAIADIQGRDIGLLLVLNGSPYERDKLELRHELVSKRATNVGAPVGYVNMVGGQDDLVFDGGSLVVDAAGKLIARAPQFEEGLMLIDLDLKSNSSHPDLILTDGPLPAYERLIPGINAPLDPSAEIWSALVLGVRDYVEKNGFSSLVLGLSGGIDSAVTAAIAADAIGGANVYGIAMPSKYSSDHSLEDAKALAINLGINFRVIEIQPLVDAFLSSMELSGVAEENLQARIRGVTLMGISNQEGHLVLATGNKSELAVGYSTLYGDAVGGFAPIKDIFKSDVWQIALWRNDFARASGAMPPIPQSSISKPPSAELREGQRDSDSLPEYDVLDQILSIYIEENGSLEAITGAGFEARLAEQVITMVDRAEFKRRQYPPGTKISGLAFGKDRRLPLTSRWREKPSLS